jgi:hypothetical protein
MPSNPVPSKLNVPGRGMADAPVFHEENCMSTVTPFGIPPSIPAKRQTPPPCLESPYGVASGQIQINAFSV